MTYVLRSNQVAARSIGGEMMIMSPVDATLFSLNEIGSVIWTAADGHTEIGEIVLRICDEFDVTPDQARLDAETFVNELASHGILKISDRPQE